MPEFVIPYAPHPGQRPFHASAARYRVLACGRRWGKTLAGLMEIVRQALSQPDGIYWVVAPTYPQAMVPWRMLKKVIPRDLIPEINNTQLFVRLVNNSVIFFKSADRPDNLRGEGLDMILVDEAAMIPREAWNDVMRPMLADKTGRAVFISTPRGYNWFFEMWRKGRGEDGHPRDPEVESFTFPTASNPHIPPKELEKAKEELPEVVWRQEFLAEFVKDLGAVFRGIENCIADTLAPPVQGEPYILGVDLGKHESFTVITVMNRLGQVVYWERGREAEWPVQKARVIASSKRYNSARVVPDATGLGDPIVDDLRAAGLPVTPVVLSAKSKEQIIINLVLLIEQQKIKFPANPILLEELTVFGSKRREDQSLRFEAPSGFTDDAVISLALAAWGFRKKFGTERSALGAAGSTDLPEYSEQRALVEFNTEPDMASLKESIGGSPHRGTGLL